MGEGNKENVIPFWLHASGMWVDHSKTLSGKKIKGKSLKPKRTLKSSGVSQCISTDFSGAVPITPAEVLA